MTLLNKINDDDDDDDKIGANDFEIS